MMATISGLLKELSPLLLLAHRLLLYFTPLILSTSMFAVAVLTLQHAPSSTSSSSQDTHEEDELDIDHGTTHEDAAPATEPSPELASVTALSSSSEPDPDLSPHAKPDPDACRTPPQTGSEPDPDLAAAEPDPDLMRTNDEPVPEPCRRLTKPSVEPGLELPRAEPDPDLDATARAEPGTGYRV